MNIWKSNSEGIPYDIINYFYYVNMEVINHISPVIVVESIDDDVWGQLMDIFS